MRPRIFLTAAGAAAALLLRIYASVPAAGPENLPPPGEPTLSAPAAPRFSLPAAIQGTELLAEALASYEGPFLEAGGDRQVCGVAALLIRNPGGEFIRSGDAVLESGGQVLRFHFTSLPPGEALLVLEQDSQPIDARSFTACYGFIQAANVSETLNEVSVREKGPCELVVTNRSENPVEGLALHYKTYSAQADIYVGGITYSITLGTLEPGESRTVRPFRYVSGYSRVVWVEVPEFQQPA